MMQRNRTKISILLSMVVMMILLIPFSAGGSFSSLIIEHDIESLQELEINKEFLVPSYVQIGDLIFIEVVEFSAHYSLWGWDHIAIYIGDNQFIDATHKGVGITTLTEFMGWGVEIAYGQVIASEEQKLQAVDFISSQMGKPYQNFTFSFSLEDLLDLDIIAALCNRTKDASSDSDAWYCSELIWAAYLHCTPPIDIDRNGDGFDRPRWVWPSEISSDDNIEMYSYHELNEWDLDEFLDWLRDMLFELVDDESYLLCRETEILFGYREK